MKGLARVAVFLAVILAVTLFMVGGQGYAQDKDKAIRLKFCHHFPVGHGQAVLYQEWAKILTHLLHQQIYSSAKLTTYRDRKRAWHYKRGWGYGIMPHLTLSGLSVSL